MESKSLKTFRRKMMNPIHWRKANRLLTQFTEAELATQAGAARFIDALASALDVSLSASERTQAAKWLSSQGVNPQSKRDRMRLWGKAK